MTPAYHSIAVSLLTGTFTLALVFTFICLWAARQGRQELLKYADYGVRISAGFGFVLSLAGLLTGAFLWPAVAVLNSPLLKNKIFTVVMLVLIWGMFLALRWWKSRDVWQMGIYRVHMGLLAVTGFLANTISNSIGGDVAGNPSGFEGLIRLLGVETRYTFYLPDWFNIGLVVAALMLLALTFMTKPSGTRSGDPDRAGQS
ncbi:MAG: hypothetical protein WD535_04730 [Thermaerobacterales bacterium]